MASQSVAEADAGAFCADPVHDVGIALRELLVAQLSLEILEESIPAHEPSPPAVACGAAAPESHPTDDSPRPRHHADVDPFARRTLSSI